MSEGAEQRIRYTYPHIIKSQLNMVLKNTATIFAAGAVLATLFAFASAASALTATCSGSPTATNITWTGTASSGIEPLAFLWGNGATSTSQTVASAVGTHTMTLQVTDASSTVATTSCSATISPAAPTISSFTASPSSITVGQSSVLAWTVANASSTSINNGVGTVTGATTTVTPSVTTTYTLTATNPGGSSTANVTVTVASSSNPLPTQIQALLAQINALKAQIAQLLIGAAGGNGTATSTPQGCFNFWRDLKHGDIGDDVKELQQQLAHDDPTIFPPGLITGFFGPKTQAAVKMWQRRYGIDPIGTGFFGMKSRGHFVKSQCSNGDADGDGTVNSADADDDNDGIPDLQDPRPFSSKIRGLDDRDKKDRMNENRGRGNGDD
jgi:peptidoglycan hydrolase-like protein with peptidoglycan-binding domain